MALFDIQKFNRYEVNNTATYVDDGTIVTMVKLADTYVEETKAPNSTYSTRSVFFESNLHLKWEGSFFYDNPTGVLNEYGAQDNLVSQTNYDSPHGFSIQNVIDLLNNNYQIDLTVPAEGLSVIRYVDDTSKLPEYSIKIPINEQLYRHILINGNTGVVISDVLGSYIED
jgi:hypothetical protein